MAARRVFHLQPCGEQPRWQEGGRHRGLDEFLQPGGSCLCPLFASDFFSPLPTAVEAFAMGCDGEGGLGDACAAVLGARGPFPLRAGGLAGFWWSHCCLGGLYGVDCWLGGGMRCCGSGLPGQLQPSGHGYGAKVLKEEKGAKGLEEEKGASPVWGWFCSGGFFRPLLVLVLVWGRWLLWGRRAPCGAGCARVRRGRMRLLDLVLVVGQTPQEKGEITAKRGSGSRVRWQDPSHVSWKCSFGRLGQEGGDLRALPNALAFWLWLNF